MENNWIEYDKQVLTDADKEFPYTQDLYDEIISSISYSKRINYESFINSILTDLHMTVYPRVMIENESDFIKFSYKTFPPNSNVWMWIRKIIGLNYLMKEKNEFIACYSKFDKEHTVQYQLRSEIEYNNGWIQHVSMALPTIIEEGYDPIYLFCKETESDMAGYTTLIGGHVSYNGEIKNFDELYMKTAIREASEELGLKEDRFINFEPDNFDNNHKKYIILDTTLNSQESSISHYHIGRCYSFKITREDIFNCKLEKGKKIILYSPNKIDYQKIDIRDCKNHTIQIYDNETFDMDVFKPDSWLQIVLKIINNI